MWIKNQLVFLLIKALDLLVLALLDLLQLLILHNQIVVFLPNLVDLLQLLPDLAFGEFVLLI